MMNVFVEFGAILALAVLSGGVVYGVSTRHTRALDVSSDLWDRLFVLLVCGYVVLFGTLAVIRYLTFHTGYIGLDTAWDLGQYGQLIWNSLNGRLLQGTFVKDTETFLGKSFTPILLTFVPLYAVWQSPIVLLIVQVLGLGVAGFPIYWFARRKLGGGCALVIALAYYLHPGLEHIGLTEFHEIALAVPLLAFAAYFLLREHYRGLFVCLALALLVKEEIGLIVVMFGVYIFLLQRRRGLGLGIVLFGIAWTVLLLQVLIPLFRGAEYGGTFYYFGQGEIGGGGARYGYLGRSVPEILTTLFTHPVMVLSNILTPEKIAYVLHLLVPLAFLSIFGAEIFTLTFPTFAYSLLSLYALQTEIRSYYFSPLLPFLFFAAVVGLRRLIVWGERRSGRINPVAWQRALAVFLIVASGDAYLLYGAGPFARNFQPHRYVVNDHTRLGNELMAMIPNDAVVIGQNEFLAHLSNRQFLYEIPVIPDYRQADYLVADATPGAWFYVHESYWRGYLAIGYFEKIVDRDGYVIARRKSLDHALNIQYDNQMTLLGYAMVVTDTQPWGMTLRPVVAWRADRVITDTYRIVMNVRDRQGHSWVTEVNDPQDGAAPTDTWQIGKPVGDQHTVRLPPTMPTDDYVVTVAVCARNRDECLAARDAAGRELGDEAEIATVPVEKNKQSFTASDLHLLNTQLVDMGELRFIGYVPPRETITPGELLQVGLYWRAREKPRGDYFVAVQLRDANGRVAFEQAARPANGTYPTTQWDVGEVLLDWHDFDLPRDLAIGNYQIFAVLRDAATGTRVGETLISTISVVK